MPGLETDLFVGWRERESYSILHQYLEECLTNAKVVVLIGYSFSDKDINARLGDTFRKNKLVHFVVLDPGRKWGKKLPGGLKEIWYEPPYRWTLDFMDLEPEAWNNRLHWIRGRFETKSSHEKLLAKVEEIL